MTTELMVAEQFSRHPGGRYFTDGPWSGQEFREKYLLPKFDSAIRDGDRLVINFDGVAGLPTSFLEEAFGGLVRVKKDLSLAVIERAVEIIAPATPRLWRFIDMAKSYMADEDRRRSAS